MRLRAKQVWGPVQVITFALLKLLALINSLCLVPFSCSLALHFSLFFFVLKSYCHTTSSFFQCCFNLIRLYVCFTFFLFHVSDCFHFFAHPHHLHHVCRSQSSNGNFENDCLCWTLNLLVLKVWLIYVHRAHSGISDCFPLHFHARLLSFILFFFLNNLSRGKLFVIHKALFSPAEQTNLGQQAILTQLHFFYFSCANDLNIFPFS